jgi:hypothetical protein
VLAGGGAGAVAEQGAQGVRVLVAHPAGYGLDRVVGAAQQVGSLLHPQILDAFRESATMFGVFDTFDDEDGRTAHLNGRIADVLKEVGPTMFAATPEIRRTDILAARLP